MRKVRDAIRLVEQCGWFAREGATSRTGIRKGREPRPSRASRVMASRRHLGQRNAASWAEGRVTEPMRYTIVIGESLGNYAVYAPDLTGCVATGSSGSEAVRETREAIRFHIESLR